MNLVVKICSIPSSSSSHWTVGAVADIFADEIGNNNDDDESSQASCYDDRNDFSARKVVYHILFTYQSWNQVNNLNAYYSHMRVFIYLTTQSLQNLQQHYVHRT